MCPEPLLMSYAARRARSASAVDSTDSGTCAHSGKAPAKLAGYPAPRVTVRTGDSSRPAQFGSRQWPNGANSAGAFTEIPDTISVTRTSGNLQSDTDASEHVDQGLRAELLELTVCEIARSRLRELEHVDDGRLTVPILMYHAQQHIEKLLTNFQMRGRPITQ
jgi:hypothetical protein